VKATTATTKATKGEIKKSQITEERTL